MDGTFLPFEQLATPLKLLTGLAIGLLLGLQREKTPSAKAGLRTFGLVGLFGTVAALVADALGNAWIVATGLALVGLMIVAAYHRTEEPEADSGTTTVIAVLLCYGLGVMVWHDRSQLAVSVAIVATLLLHFKTELHGLSARLSRQDVASILQFAVLTFIILPLLPDRGIGPYRVLNPHHVWLMVVLVSGVSLIGYLALRLAGTQRSLLLVGAFGGLVSSTATTLVYAREAHARPAMLPIGGAIIVIANLVVLVRLAVMSAAFCCWRDPTCCSTAVFCCCKDPTCRCMTDVVCLRDPTCCSMAAFVCSRAATCCFRLLLSVSSVVRCCSRDFFSPSSVDCCCCSDAISLFFSASIFLNLPLLTQPLVMSPAAITATPIRSRLSMVLFSWLFFRSWARPQIAIIRGRAFERTKRLRTEPPESPALGRYSAPVLIRLSRLTNLTVAVHVFETMSP